jgi:hypothetical protein
MIIIGVALAAFWSSGSIAVICPSVGQYFKISSPICFVRHIFVPLLYLACDGGGNGDNHHRRLLKTSADSLLK